MAKVETGAWFETTVWGLVVSARSNRSDLEILLRAYWSPVYAFLRRKGFSAHDAADVTQDFLAEVMIGRDLVGKADPERGRFRSFLKASLHNFLIDRGRRATKKRAAPSTPLISLDAAGVADGAAAADEEPAREFDRQWAAAVLAITVERLESAAKQESMEAQWEAFKSSVLDPLLRRTKQLSMEQLAEKVGAASPEQASNMVQTMKRRFRRTLRQVVAETVSDPTQVDDELASLSKLLA